MGRETLVGKVSQEKWGGSGWGAQGPGVQGQVGLLPAQRWQSVREHTGRNVRRVPEASATQHR